MSDQGDEIDPDEATPEQVAQMRRDAGTNGNGWHPPAEDSKEDEDGQ